MSNYVEQRDGGYFIKGKRVSLDSIVYAYRRGQSPESIQRSFPLTTIEEVYGAIAYYLAHQPSIDEYLLKGEEEFDRMHAESRAAYPDWYDKMDRARKELLVSKG